ncbi:MAG: di-trans,poly-cis-decaprenylcistransferase [bacterium]|nr:di-trans,poly-cis-decaprenylcistransferase [bacterium]
MKKNKIPNHIAIIMDGNARWAALKSLPRFKGHQKGAEIIEDIVKKAEKLNVRILTLYAFSTENWHREKKEVDYLMELLYKYLKGPIVLRMMKNNIKLDFIGDITEFSIKLQEEIRLVREKTKNNTGILVNIALNYGSRDEIVAAVNQILQENKKKITKEEFSAYLHTPDPDLLIRTGGEFRLSNFLLWQSAYSEIFVTEKYWPDFDETELENAIEVYSKRNRRYGGRNE